jgi:energy-coupling factor transporter ATP-binding protein EcfA2
MHELASEDSPFSKTDSLFSSVFTNLNSLTQQYGVLVVGQMGSGKSSLINSVLGLQLSPASTVVNTQSDTLALIEFTNDPFMKNGRYQVDVVLKTSQRWDAERLTWLNAQDRTKMESRVASTPGTQTQRSTDLLEALYTFDSQEDINPSLPHDLTKIVRYLAATKKPAQSATGGAAAAAGAPGAGVESDVDGQEEEEEEELDLALSRDVLIHRALKKPKRSFMLKSREETHNLICRLCRAATCTDADLADVDQQEVADLLAFGDPWPLIRVVKVRARFPSAALPPFCRLIDTPGLGQDKQVVGIDALENILDSVQFGTVTEVWYVMGAGRFQSGESGLQQIVELHRRKGLERVRFVVTRTDNTNVVLNTSNGKALSMPQRVAKEESQRDIFVGDVVAKMGLTGVDLTHMEQLLKQRTFFVSAWGYLAVKRLPGLHKGEARKLRKIFFKDAANTRVEELVSGMLTSIQTLLQASVSRFQNLINQLVTRISTEPAKQSQSAASGGGSAAAAAGSASEDASQDILRSASEIEQMRAEQSKDLQLPLKQLGVKARRRLEGLAHVFLHADKEPRKASSSAEAAEQAFSQRAYRLPLSVVSQVRGVLSPLHHKTLQAVIRGRGVMPYGDIDVGRTVFSRVRATQPADGVEFALQWAALFADIEKRTSVILDKVFDGFTRVVSESVRLSARTHLVVAKQDLQSDLLSAREGWSSSSMFAQQFANLQDSNDMWDAVTKKMSDSKRNKCANAIRRMEKYLDEHGSDMVKQSTLQWLLSQCRSEYKTLVNRVLARFNRELQREFAMHEDEVRAAVQALLECDRQEWLTPAQRELVSAYLKKSSAKAAARVAVKSEAHPSRGLSDSVTRWIFADDEKQRVLIFRGLCGTEDNDTPILLIPQQTIFTAMANCDSSLGTALAESSGFAVLEAVADALAAKDAPFKSRLDRGAISIREIQDKLRQYPNLDSLLTADALRAKSALIRKHMLGSDTPAAEAPLWKQFIKAWHRPRDRTVSNDRQEMYTNNSKSFMELWTHYLTRYRNDRQHLSCPWEYSEGHKQVQAWFYYRWCSPGLFRLPHLQPRDSVHTNPFISCSQGLEHALRYAVGLKPFRAAQAEGNMMHVYYNAQSRSLDPKRVLGVLLVFRVRKDYIYRKEGNDVHVLLEQLKRKEVSLNEDRIGSEAEVTMYGGMPGGGDSELWKRVALRAPHLDTDNPLLLELYGLKADSKECDILRSVAARLPPDSSSEFHQARFRQLLGIAAGKQIENTLNAEFGSARMNFKSQILNR